MALPAKIVASIMTGRVELSAKEILAFEDSLSPLYVRNPLLQGDVYDCGQCHAMDLARAQGEIYELSERCAGMQHYIDASRIGLANSEAENKESVAQINRLKTELVNSQAENKESVAQIDRLKIELKHLQEINSSLERRIREQDAQGTVVVAVNHLQGDLLLKAEGCIQYLQGIIEQQRSVVDELCDQLSLFVGGQQYIMALRMLAPP